MSIGTPIRDWWNQEVDVVRFLDFLESRALAGHVRVLIGGWPDCSPRPVW